MKLQTIHVNRRDVNSIEFDVQELTIPLSPGDEMSFEIKVINYGTPTHIHLSATEEIRDKITFLSHNPYVRYEETIPVVARLPRKGKEQYMGEIVVTTGYGAKKSRFVTKLGLEEEKRVVEVDEGLGERRYVKVRKQMAIDLTLVEHPLVIPTMLILIAVLLTLVYVEVAQVGSAIMASVLIIFVMLYCITKLVKV